MYRYRFLLQFHHPSQADSHALHRHVQAQQALHRPNRHTHVSRKSDQRAQLPGALDNPPTTHQERAGAAPRGQCAGDGLGEEFGHLHLQQLAHVTLPKLVQAPCFPALLAGRLDELHRRQGLDQKRRHIRRALTQVAHFALHLAPHPAQPQHLDRHQQRQQQRQLPRQHQHQRHRTHQADHRRHRREQRVHGKALDLCHIAIQPRKNVADTPPPVEGWRQLLQMAVKIVAQGEQDAPRQARMQVAVDAGQHRAQQARADHDCRHVPKRLVILGQQPFVDQSLDQPGLRQRQQRCTQRQAEQKAYGAPMWAHETIQPGQRLAHEYRVAGVHQPCEQAAHVSRATA